MKTMDMKKKYLLGMIIILLIQCKSNTISTNEIALALVKLENEGLISQSEKKYAFFRFLDEIYLKFDNYGYGHRIDEMTSTWNLYEDGSYLIMTGSVAKTDKDIYIFTILFQDKEIGVYDIVYEEVGRKKIGSYPKDIIPYKY